MKNLRHITGRVGFIFCLVLCWFSCSAQTNLHLEKVEGEGLTSGYVKCITQDKKGFLWFGSEEGLFRYDGYQFKSFHKTGDGTQTLVNNNIEFLYPDESGFLWVGNRGGLSRIDTRSLQITNFSTPISFTVYSIVPQTDSSFWVGTNVGLFSFSKTKQTWRQEIFIDKKIFIRNLSRGADGNLYIITHEGFYIYNPYSRSCRHFDLPIPAGHKSRLPICHRSLFDSEGNLWITTWNAGLIKFCPSTYEMQTYLTFQKNKSFAPFVSFYDLLFDNLGKLWTANSENGITIFDTAHQISVTTPLFWSPDKSIPDRVYSLFHDRSGIWWIGTENGIYKSDPNRLSLSKIDFKTEKATPAIRPDLTPLSMLKDRQGFWWMGTYEGLFLFDSATGLLKSYNKDAGIPPHSLINSLLEDKTGNIWISAGHWMVRLTKKKNGNKQRFESKRYFNSGLKSNITVVYPDHLNRWWIGTHANGIFELDTRKGILSPHLTIDTTIPVNKNEIRGILELPDGTILLGGEHTGLIKFYPGDDHYEKLESFNKNTRTKFITINSISRDLRGKIWIGTDGDGLWETDDLFHYFHQYTTADGLPSMNVETIQPAPNDHVWLNTDGGSVDFRPLQKKMTVFDKETGIRNLYSLFSMLLLQNGSVVIGDMACIHIIPGNEILNVVTSPQVMITGLKIFDAPYPLTDSSQPELNYNQNYFSFEYVALNFTQSARNQYKYMLEGIDQNWTDAGTRRYTSYANLKEGHYIFKVKARNNEGEWSTSPATLSFIIRPPLWHRWWFYLGTVIIIVSLVYALYQIRINQLRSKERLRNKIARDLHDDIGSTLSGINIFSRLALQKLNTDRDGSGELLRRIGNRAEKTMEALSDIVWSINSSKDNMVGVLVRMREYLGELLEPLGIHYEFSIDPQINHRHIDMEIRRDIYLIFKEAVYNASKYSNADFIRVALRKAEKGIIAMDIVDNGTGFDLDTIIPGNGIQNMRERARKIHATIDIKSGPDRGTNIRLLFSVT